MSGVFVGASLGFFPFHYDAGSALLGGGLDAFRFLFFIGSFSHCLRRPNGSVWLYEDMMMAFCFLYFLYNPQCICVEWCSELLHIQVYNSFWIR